MYERDQHISFSFQELEQLQLLTHLRVTNVEDIVPAIPPVSFSFMNMGLFKHTGINMYQYDSGFDSLISDSLLSMTVIEEIVAYISSKFDAAKPQNLFGFLSMTSHHPAAESSFHLGELAKSFEDHHPDVFSVERFLNMQRDSMYKWFDSLKSIKTSDLLSANVMGCSKQDL